MADMRFTPTQQDAIFSRGGAVLVSAAAGSGKTRVLTERLMAYLTDAEDPADLDQFLIITFTRAAAGELRARILDAIAQRIAADPDNRGLRRQSALCARAQIGTIHSFCGALLRDHCAEAGLSPDFAVIDDQRAEGLMAAALEKTLDAAYVKIETDDAMRLLVDTVGAGRDDRRLAALVRQLYDKMQSHPRPEVWADTQIRALRLEGVTDAGETIWGKELLAGAARTLRHWSDAMDRLMQTLAEPKNAWLGDRYIPNFDVSAEGIRRALRAAGQGWDAACAAIGEIAFPRMSVVRNPVDPALKDRIKAERDRCKYAVEQLQKQFTAASDTLLGDLAATAPAMERLLRLALDFGAAYQKEKRRRALVDYADLEHLAAQLLTDEAGRPTALARSVSERFREIMVDEYQDVSEVQDLIFRAVSRAETNLFFVGDVKQSIYRFRLADPTIFLDKYDRFSPAEAAAPGEAKRILLQENFRSRERVLQAANHVFSNIMSTELGELDYDENARLKRGLDAQAGGERAELHLLQLPDADDGPPAEKAALEADYAARQIRALIDGGVTVREGDDDRPADWGDVVILLRSANAIGPIYRQALTAHGIPVESAQGSGFFRAPEISVLISLLAVIDNPHQDVPLIAVLRSALFGFTPDELSAIRVCDRAHDFYTALCVRAEEDARCADFLRVLESYRRLAPDMALSELLWQIYDERELFALCAAMPDGEARRQNLTELFELSRDFEATGYRGLHRFVDWLRRQAESGTEPTAVPAARRAVRIMSIHRSKGLEFPIVFLCDLSRRFNKSDTTATVLVHPALGLGPKRTDPERGVEYPTFARAAVAARTARETLSEEMRLLYVAMTRAKERLVMTGTLADPEKTLQKLDVGLTSPIAPELLRTASSPLAWLMMTALLPGADDALALRIAPLASPEETAAALLEPPTPQEADPDETARLKARLSFRYPYAAAQALPSKVTATELKRLDAESGSDGAALLKKPWRTFRRPDFSAVERGLTAAERGTATHRVLQYLRFADAVTSEGVQAQIAELIRAGYLSAREGEAVLVDTIVGLMRSELGARLIRAEREGRVRREFRFSLLCPAGDFFPDAPEEDVLLQGVVDCCFEEEGALVVVDYKTDRIGADGVAARTDYYASQLRAYGDAMARILALPVKQRLLFFLHGGYVSEVK